MRILIQFVSHCSPDTVRLKTRFIINSLAQAREDTDSQLDALEVVHFMASRGQWGAEDAGEVAETILVPMLKWRPGLVQSKIRKIILIILIQMGICRGLDPVFSSLDDQWSPDNRLLSIVLIGRLIDRIDRTALPDLSSRVKQRLDDTNPVVRRGAASILRDLPSYSP